MERSHDLFSNRLTVVAYGSKLDYGCWKRKSDELFYLIIITNKQDKTQTQLKNQINMIGFTNKQKI